ncbi:hypothetical protein [Microterricola viridarii]|uniref:PH domain-containing protein n=1 Tax=Microterricola viridarii TaxID=412690 RepID=A0A0X8E3H2_9MICO|nr:hypothetical protein [Microterricola viridarii]AMB58356.1 hypothetical protein AWU67_05255 [Microterricola viridarii]
MSVERLLLTALLAVVVLVLLLVMVRSWRRRGRRDQNLAAYPLPAAPAVPQLSVRANYVATTRHDLPLERLLPAGLRFRAQGMLHVAQDGLTIDLPGAAPLFIPSTPSAVSARAAGPSTAVSNRVASAWSAGRCRAARMTRPRSSQTATSE